MMMADEPKPRIIVFVANTTEYGGAEKHLLELVRRMGGSGVRRSILCLGPDFYSERLNGDPSASITVRRAAAPASLWGWRRLFRDARPDVVVFVCGWLFSFPWYASVAARLAGARRLFWLVHLKPDPVPVSLQRSPVRNIVRRIAGPQIRLRLGAHICTSVICVSNAIRDTLIGDYRFPVDKTVAIHNGISISEFVPSADGRAALRSRLGLDSEDVLFVAASRLSAVKGIDILLGAMDRVLRNGLRCKCVIIGDGPLRQQLSEQASAMGLQDAVFFEGFQQDVRPYFRAADAFVLTSHREGLPIAVLEAMASGLPCVVTDVGGNAEAVTHRVDGLVISPGSVYEAAEALSYMVRRPRERVEMSRRARTRVCEGFDIETKMAETIRLVLG